MKGTDGYLLVLDTGGINDDPRAAMWHAECLFRLGRFAGGGAVLRRDPNFVLAGGAINSPALLLRSQAPDPHGRLGQRGQ